MFTGQAPLYTREPPPFTPPLTDAIQRGQAALQRLYGDRTDFESFVAEVRAMVEAARLKRPKALRELDEARQALPKWYLRPGRPAYCTYIDRFANDLKGCVSKIPYLKELGVGLFHPLPLLKPREGDSDGGFAVVDYREVDPRLGTFDELTALAGALRDEDMSLVLDVVCNHTAREHIWAKAWLAGDPDYADFYICLKSQEEMEAWSRSLSDVFPDTAPGSFTWDDEARGWMWTTFYPFQWDLNYANPRVFLAMLGVLLDLANAGVEGFRLDSAAYLWKIKGTICRNLPQAHDILQAFRSYLSEAAPGVFLLAEAIEGLDEVLSYFGSGTADSECDLAYNNTPMTALWGALAEGRADAISAALQRASTKPSHGTWLNYARCHDDIIWQALSGWVAQDRLRLWSDFYAGGDASFADGLAFQAPGNLAPSTCGMAASLSGIDVDGFGIDRLKLIYSVIYALDGVPMIYMGDEIALANDRRFLDDPQQAGELRWLHRPLMDWEHADGRYDLTTTAGAMVSHLQRLNALQTEISNWTASAPSVSAGEIDNRILHILRKLPGGEFHCLANMSDETIGVPVLPHMFDAFTKKHLTELRPYQVAWFIPL